MGNLRKVKEEASLFWNFKRYKARVLFHASGVIPLLLRTKPDPRLDALSKIALFSSLNRKELAEIDTILHERRFLPGEIIFEEGEEGLGMYIVLQGSVKVTRKALLGSKELIVLGAGDFFGELSLLERSPRLATTTAVDHVTVLGIFRTELMNLLEENKYIGMKLGFQLARHTAESLRKALAGEQSYTAG